MKISHGIGHEPSLQRLVIASVVLHFILMSLIFIPFKTGEREFKTYYVNLVEPAKVSGGGETAARKAVEKPIAKKETKETSAKEKKRTEDKEIAAAKEKMALKAAKTRQTEEDKNKEIDRLAALKAIKEKREKTRSIEVEKNEASAEGTGGSQTGSKEVIVDPYYGLITEKIQDEWSTYPTFESEGLEVEILIKIDSNGKVVPKIEKSSGNKIFDEAAIKTIIKASPLPPPPPLVDKEIVVRLRG